MGWKFEVNQWVRKSYGYEFEQVYAGKWLLLAIWAMVKAKRHRAGYVKLEWR